jgi:hypothetical protein
MFYHWSLKEFFQTSFSKMRAKMPKDEEEDRDGGKHQSKKVTFALNDIHHEIDDEPNEDEDENTRIHERPKRCKVPSYVIGRPLGDYDATDGTVSQLILSLLACHNLSPLHEIH